MAEEKAPKAVSKKKMTLGIVLAVIVVAAIGLFAWHNTPGFCGTVCHSTMNEHLQNFEGTDASKGAGLAHVHAQANLGCLDCHEADLSTQTSEVHHQITGTYDPAELELGAGYYVDSEKCLSCHGGSWEALDQKTAHLGDYNPHDCIHGNMTYCGECHKGHVEQVDICGQCHPNGGQTMKG